MKLSKNMLNTLKNFTAINVNLFLEEGSTHIYTGDRERATMLSRSRVDDGSVPMPVDFGIYDLNEFLGAVSLFNEPEIEFDAAYCTIYESGNKRKRIKYYSADRETLTIPKKTSVEIPDDSVVATFDLDAESLKSIVRSASLLQLECVTFAIDGDSASIGAYNRSSGNEASNTFSIDLSDDVVRGPAFDSSSGVFELSVDKKSISPLPLDYKVTVSDKIMMLESKSDQDIDITYWYASMSKSES